ETSDELRPLQPRTDEAHITPEDGKKLRELVHGRCPQHPTNDRDPAVVLRRPHRTRRAFGVLNHRTELHDAEDPPPMPDPSLAVEDRAAILELNGNPNQRPQWGRSEQTERR